MVSVQRTYARYVRYAVLVMQAKSAKKQIDQLP